MDINSISQGDDNVTKKEDMPMKNASQLNYNIIDEYKAFLQKTPWPESSAQKNPQHYAKKLYKINCTHN